MKKSLFAAVLVCLRCSAQDTKASQITVENPGSFTGATNHYHQVLINGADLNLHGMEQQPVQAAVAGGISVPSSAATTHNINAIQGMVDNSCNSNAGTRCNAVGGYFVGQALGKGSFVEGINAVVGDTADTTGAWVTGVELDVGSGGRTGLIRGLSIHGSGDGACQVPGCGIGIEVDNFTGTFRWDAIARFGNFVKATPTRTNTLAPLWFDSTYWNGSSSTMERLQFGPIAGSGKDPTFRYIWSHQLGTRGQTLIGAQAPLVSALFTTSGAAVTFPLASSGAAYSKQITVPNDNANNATYVVTGQNGTFKSQRFGATRATAGSANATAQTTYRWTAAFGDANYTPVCSPAGTVTGTPVYQGISSFDSSGVTIQIMSVTAAASSFGAIYCTAVHD